MAKSPYTQTKEYGRVQTAVVYQDLLDALESVPKEMQSQNWSNLHAEVEIKLYDSLSDQDR